MKNVLITGGVRGIGRAITEKYAKNGYNIYVLYFKNDAIASEIEQKFKNVKTFRCDISKYEEVLKVKSKINYKIDIIINNAGISSYGLFSDATENDFDNIFDINVKGTFNITNIFIKDMIANQNGNIINISSMWGEVGASMEVLYSASKGAIISFTKALAKEMGLSKIRVNCITPGVIKTDMTSTFDQETIDCLVDETPLNRLGTPEDIANLAYFLSSEHASFITGQIIGCSGGFVI